MYHTFYLLCRRGLRGRADNHAGRDHPAHRHRVGGVGQPRSGCVRQPPRHALAHALRLPLRALTPVNSAQPSSGACTLTHPHTLVTLHMPATWADYRAHLHGSVPSPQTRTSNRTKTLSAPGVPSLASSRFLLPAPHRPRGVQVHEVVQPRGQRARSGLPAHPGHRRPTRPAGMWACP